MVQRAYLNLGRSGVTKQNGCADLCASRCRHSLGHVSFPLLCRLWYTFDKDRSGALEGQEFKDCVAAITRYLQGDLVQEGYGPLRPCTCSPQVLRTLMNRPPDSSEQLLSNERSCDSVFTCGEWGLGGGEAHDTSVCLL